MESGYSILLNHASIAIFILFFSSTHIIISTTAIRPLTNNDPNTQYIKTSCRNTTDPKLCFESLSSYATKIQKNPKMLAYVALNVTLKATKSASELMKNMSKLHSLKPKEASVVADCVEVTDDAVDEIRRSIGEMGRARSSGSNREINDIQTWTSAALTDDNTCMDGFGGSGMDGEVKTIVEENLTKVARLTNIALALINSFASSSQEDGPLTYRTTQVIKSVQN